MEAQVIKIDSISSDGITNIVSGSFIDGNGDEVCILKFSPKTDTVSIYKRTTGDKTRRLYSGEDLKVSDYLLKGSIKCLTFVIYSIAVRQMQLFCTKNHYILDCEKSVKGSRFDTWVDMCCKEYLQRKSRVE